MRRTVNNSPATYGEVPWTKYDVKSIRPHWSLKRCEEELSKNEKYLRDRLTELGWEVLEDLLPPNRPQRVRRKEWLG